MHPLVHAYSPPRLETRSVIPDRSKLGTLEGPVGKPIITNAPIQKAQTPQRCQKALPQRTSASDRRVPLDHFPAAP